MKDGIKAPAGLYGKFLFQPQEEKASTRRKPRAPLNTPFVTEQMEALKRELRAKASAQPDQGKGKNGGDRKRRKTRTQKSVFDAGKLAELKRLLKEEEARASHALIRAIRRRLPDSEASATEDRLQEIYAELARKVVPSYPKALRVSARGLVKGLLQGELALRPDLQGRKVFKQISR